MSPAAEETGVSVLVAASDRSPSTEPGGLATNSRECPQWGGKRTLDLSR